MQNLRNSILFCLLLTAYTSRAQDAEVIQQYINTYRDLAIEEMQRTGVPASIKLAQGIHETMAGTSDLVIKSNNHFGIKCKDTWTGESVTHDDDLRGECFRKYLSAAESYRDHSNFLKGSSRYASLFNLDPVDYKHWAFGLKKAGYATNPQYPQIIIKLIEDYHLQDYTIIALGKTPVREDVIVKAPTENVIVKSPIENVIVKVPIENVIVKSPIENVIVKSPIENVIVKSPIENVIAKTPIEKVIVKSPIENVIVKVPMENMLKNNAIIGIKNVAVEEKKDAVEVKREEPIKQPEKAVIQPLYPEGEFKFNETRVVYAKKGTSFMAIAQAYDVPLARVFEFNDMVESETVDKDQLIYIQRKRKTGNNEFHTVQPGETLYDIAQEEAIRLETLVEYNLLNSGMNPAIGEQLYLRKKAPAMPRLAVKENYSLYAGQIKMNTTSTENTKQGIVYGTLPQTNVISYTVQPKETIYFISKKYNVKIDDIVKWNQLNGYDLMTGQKLKIYK